MQQEPPSAPQYTAFHGEYRNQSLAQIETRPKKLVVLLPALNEERTIGEMVDRIPREGMPGVGEVEVIVVDDGSTDATAEIAAKRGAKVISHPVNLGLGAAIANGMEAALRSQADVIVNMDSDGQFTPEDITKLVKLIVEENYGLVTCTRYGDPKLIPRMPWIKKWGGIAMSRLVNWVISGAKFTDVSCGFRAYSREAALRLNILSRFTYTQESLIDLADKGIRMAQIPLQVRGVREYGESRVASNLFDYGLRTSTIILRAMRDTRPLVFFGLQAVVFLLVGAVTLIATTVLTVTNSLQPNWQVLGFGVGAAVLLIGFVTAVMALLADQIGRLRRIQESVLYLLRRHDMRTDLEHDLHADHPSTLSITRHENETVNVLES